MTKNNNNKIQNLSERVFCGFLRTKKSLAEKQEKCGGGGGGGGGSGGKTMEM